MKINKIIPILLLVFTFPAHSKALINQEISKVFKNYHACFILYHVNTQKIVNEYNPQNRCNQRISPNSTFKIPLSLMAFNQETINQDTVFHWNGEKGILSEHERNQTPASWLKFSVVWVSQLITSELGYARIKNYLARFQYGNQDFSGDLGKNNGLTHAWLSSSLKISAFEQLSFLKGMINNTLSINRLAILNTKQNLYLGKLENGDSYYGKTGSGRHGQIRDGWFVGIIENDKEQYIFISNLSDKKTQIPNKTDGDLTPFGGQILKPITMQLLNDYFK